MKRFVIQESEKENHYVVTDQTNKLVVIFEKGKFNETSKVTELENQDPNDFMKIAKQLREVGEWIYNHHKDKI